MNRRPRPDAAPLATALVAADGVTCPACGSPLQVVTDGLVGQVFAPARGLRNQPPQIRMVPAPFAACTGCEWCVELRP